MKNGEILKRRNIIEYLEYFFKKDSLRGKFIGNLIQDFCVIFIWIFLSFLLGFCFGDVKEMFKMIKEVLVIDSIEKYFRCFILLQIFKKVL